MSFFGSDTGNLTARWQPEPDGRGTFSILSTCLITMLLCVWTAVHLNVPAYGSRVQYWRKAMWLTFALLAPELVLYNAFRQFQEARSLGKAMRASFGQNQLPEGSAWRSVARGSQTYISNVIAKALRLFAKESTTPEHQGPSIHNPGDIEMQVKDRHEWTMSHSHLALMGGFALDTRTAPINFLPRGRSRMAITYPGLAFIAKKAPELIPDLSQEQILDKSKGSVFAKTLVCLQALWFCAQVITRLAQGLSICVLELNTFAHAICALIISCLWWHKPLDVEEPILIEVNEMRSIGAIMALFYTFNSSHRRLGNGRGLGFAKFDLDPYCLSSERTSATLEELEPDIFGVKHDQRVVQTALVSPPVLGSRRIRMWPGQSLYGFCFCGYFRRTSNTIRIFTGGFDPSYSSDNYVDIFESDLECMRLAFPALLQYDMIDKEAGSWTFDIFPRLHRPVPAFKREYDDFLWGGSGMLRDRVENIGGYTVRDDAGYERPATAFTLAGLCYGGIHLLAWNTPFATRLQQLLWRISAASLAGSAVVYILYVLFLLSRMSVPIKWVHKRVFERPADALLAKFRGWRDTLCWNDSRRCSSLVWIVGKVLYFLWSPRYLLLGVFPLMALVSLLYLFARVYIVVECFINVAFLPDSAYKTPNWSQYVPHIA